MALSKREQQQAALKEYKAQREQKAGEKEKVERKKKVSHRQRCSALLILTLGRLKSIGT